MDGIDGLLGGLTLVGASVLSIIAYQLQQYELTLLFLAIIGSIIGFLRYNLSKKKSVYGRRRSAATRIRFSVHSY